MKRLHALVASLPQEIRRALVLHSVLGAASTTGVLVVVTLAAQHAQSGHADMALLLLLGLAILVFATSQGAVMRSSAQQVGAFIHARRTELFQDIRQATPAALDAVGRQPLHAALTRDCQLITRHLPYLVMALQQAVLLIGVGVYIAYLSVIAFVITALFCALATGFHMRRMQALAAARLEAVEAERTLFDGLRGVLAGFKELKLSRDRSAAIGRELAGASSRTRDSNTAIQKRLGFQFTLIEALFYVLVGLTVFVAPIFVSDYQTIVIPASTAALFLIGPMSTLAITLPAVGDVETAMANIEALHRRLRDEQARAADETSLPLEGEIQTLALRDIRFRYPEEGGLPGFALGPVSARFQAGEITFVTGGNGAGKSTLLHLLTALVPAQSGAILVNGRALQPGQEQAYRDRISAVFYDYHLFRVLYGIGTVDPDRAAELLQRLEMAQKVEIRDGAFSTVDLSSGQRKRLALVLAELEDKPIIVLDEWAADQDPHFRKVFYREILPDLKRRGKIVICVTHDDRYFDAADQILRMDEGKLTRN